MPCAASVLTMKRPWSSLGRNPFGTSMKRYPVPTSSRSETTIASDPNVYMANIMVGAIGSSGGSLNTGRIWVELKPRNERNVSVDQLIAQLRPKIGQIPGIRAFMTNQPPINLGSGQGGQRALYQYTLQDTDTQELYKYAPILEEK